MPESHSEMIMRVEEMADGKAGILPSVEDRLAVALVLQEREDLLRWVKRFAGYESSATEAEEHFEAWELVDRCEGRL